MKADSPEGTDRSTQSQEEQAATLEAYQGAVERAWADVQSLEDKVRNGP
jgi:hypothetical protein